nr:MAG TPA: hypothetical protein [Caudoviricetes sp.]
MYFCTFVLFLICLLVFLLPDLSARTSNEHHFSVYFIPITFAYDSDIGRI